MTSMCSTHSTLFCRTSLIQSPRNLRFLLELQLLHEDVSVKLSLPERFFVLMEEPTSSFAGVVVSNLM